MLLFVDAQYASPYAMSVVVALKEKGISFDMQTIDLGAGANHSLDFTRKSLTQRVPTLIDGDFALSESSAITEYLDDVYPKHPLYPAEPKAKARARQLQAWLRSDLMPIRLERSTEVMFCQAPYKPLSAVAETAAQKLYSLADTLLHQGSTYLFGSCCIADVDLAVMLNRLVLAGDSVPVKLAHYATKQWERRSVQFWVNQPRPSLELV